MRFSKFWQGILWLIVIGYFLTVFLASTSRSSDVGFWTFSPVMDLVFRVTLVALCIVLLRTPLKVPRWRSGILKILVLLTVVNVLFRVRANWILNSELTTTSGTAFGEFHSAMWWQGGYYLLAEQTGSVGFARSWRPRKTRWSRDSELSNPQNASLESPSGCHSPTSGTSLLMAGELVLLVRDCSVAILAYDTEKNVAYGHEGIGALSPIVFSLTD